jgi:hypothetical protein
LFTKHNNPIINIDLNLYEKESSRLPESLWFSFNPIIKNSNLWMINKINSYISPFDIIKNGSIHLHSINKDVKNENFQIISIDSSLVSPMEPIAFPSPLNKIKNDGGMHFNLYNNIWGTKYFIILIF